MADEVEKNTGAEEQSEPVKKKSGPPMGLIIGIVVAVLLLGGGGFFMFTQLNSAEAAEGEEGEEEVEITETNIFFSGYEADIVNLEESPDYSFMYLKFAYDLEVSDEVVIEELTLKQPRVISTVAGVMSNRNWTEIGTAQGRDRLGREVMDGINDILTEGQIIGVYFTTFVAQ